VIDAKPLLIGVVGLSSTTLIAVVDAVSGVDAANLEKLGIAAFTVGILSFLLKLERDERRETAKEYRALQDDIRKTQNTIIADHSEAMREHGRAQVRLADVLDRAARPSERHYP
jgi:DNA-binding protein H-NS